MLAIFQNSHWRVFRGVVVFWTIFSFLLGQAVFAGALENAAGVPYQTDEELKKEGFVGEEYISQLKGREAFQREKMKEMSDIHEGFQGPKNNLMKQLDNVEGTAEQIKQINEMQSQKSIGSLRKDSEKNASLVASFGRKYIKYGDGKKVWTFAGLVTDVENERIYDKHGNLSIRNTRNMKYDDQYQMVSYESDTVDPLGNKTGVKWSGGLYWTKEDESKDARKKAGQLSSFREVRTDEIGVENEAVWKDIVYYTDSDELKTEAHQSGQMAGYRKTEVNEASPERMDTIETTDIEYLKRNILIYPKSDDPKEKDRRKRESEQYETLMTGFHETRETFGVVTEREWRKAEYNDFSELVYYEEHSSTLGVDTDKDFAWASYDEYGRMDSFKEVSTTYGSETEKTRLYTDYNNENQVVGYGEESITDGVLTSVVRDQMSYNVMNQLVEYHEILTNSEGYERELMRYGMDYDLRGLLTHYVDEYDESGIHWTVERSDISYNENGFLSGYYETRHENAEYLAPDGESVVIDRTTVVERLSTDYNANGLEAAYHERITDTIGLVTDVFRTEMAYEGDKLTAYHEKREIRGKLRQSALKVNSLNQLTQSGDEWLSEAEELDYGYTTEKIFYGAKYSGGKLVEYTEEETDSRREGYTVTRHRYDQIYGSNGKVVSYKEEETTEASGEKAQTSREWKDGVYDAMGRTLSYKEITRNSLGTVSEKIWKALAYNPISLIEAYSEEVKDSGETVSTERTKIKYNNLDQMLYYEEKIREEQSGRESQKIWKTIKGYNSVGLLLDWQETTLKGALKIILYRHHLVYSRLGNLRQYIQEQAEEGGYQNISGQTVSISRKSLFERVETIYDGEGREKEYWELRKEPNGVEVSLHRQGIEYQSMGGVKSFLEDAEYKASYLGDSIENTDPPSLSAGGRGTVNYTYTITRKRLDSGYDAGNRLTGYKEEVIDSRKPELRTLLERLNQQYTGTSAQLTHYEESKTLSCNGEDSNYSTIYDAEYHAAGMLLKSTERVTDFLGTVHLQTYEAISFNALDLAESTREVSWIEDSGQKVGEVIKEKSAILYDGLDQRVSYQETQKESSGGAVVSQTDWTGSYYAGSDLLRTQTCKIKEGDLVKTQTELARVYDALGRLSENLTITTEEAERANRDTTGENSELEKLYEEADALNPADMNLGGDLLETTLEENYHIETVTHKKNVTFDGAGNETGYQETKIQRDNGNNIQTTVTTRQVSNQLIDGRLTDWKDTQIVSYSLLSGDVAYQTVTQNRVEGWNSARGQASKTYALVTDSRKAEEGQDSRWSEERIRDSILYDSDNRVLSYIETLSEKAVDNSLETSLLVERTATQYDLQGRETEVSEVRTEIYEGASGTQIAVSRERDWKGLYSSVGLLESYEEKITYPGSGAIQSTKRDSILYDHLGREQVYLETTQSADNTVRRSLNCMTAYNGNSRNLLSSTQVSETEGLEVSELLIRSGMAYDGNANLKSYQENLNDYGKYYTDHYAGERGPLGLSLTPLSSTQRLDTVRNSLGQTASYSEVKTDLYGIETTTDRTEIKYSSRGQEISYHEESAVTGDLSGTLALSYTLARDYSTETFNTLGLAESTWEKNLDSRRSALASEVTKNLEYNTSTLLLSGCTQVSHEYEADAAGMIVSDPAYDLTVTSLRSAMTYDKSRLTHYNEDTTQGISLSYESGEWTTGEKEKETLEWSASFIEGTSLYASVTEKRTLGGLITLSEKSELQYNSFGQETGYKTVSTDASGWATTVFTSHILYNTLSQQSAFDTLTRSQGVETTSRRSKIQYNLSGQTSGYEEIRREKDESGLALGLDRLTLSERLLQLYNNFGQMISYSETALTPFGLSEISVLASGFSAADYLSLGISDISSQYMHTTTARNQMKYTKENQLYAYHEDISVTGFLDQTALTLSNDYTGLAPESAVSAAEADVTVSTERHHDYEIIAFDTKGREVSSTDTEEELWTDASGMEHTLTQRTAKKNIAYDQNGCIQSYLQTAHLFDTDLSLLNKKTVTERKSTQYTASGKTLETDEILTEYEADAQTILEVSEKIWNGTYYEGTDTLSKTVEQTTITDSNPAVLKGLKTTKIREGLLSDASQAVLGITYNECGLEESYAEVEYQENILTGEKASYATVSRVAETGYNDLGKLMSQRKETGSLTGEFDDAALSAWKKDTAGNWNLNGTYILTSQSKWQNGVYDIEGNLTAYHQVTMPFGTDFSGFSTQAQQTENLYSASSHVFFQNATYDAFGRQISSRKTTWDYYDDTDGDGVEEGINQREDERIEDCVYDALGRLTGNAEFLRTRQGTVDYFAKTLKTSTYGGMIQTGSESLVFTESDANVSYTDTDPRAYGILAVKRCFSEITYDSLMRQVSYIYSETEGEHDTSAPFVFIPDSSPKEVYTRSGISYDIRGRLYAYVDSYAWKDYVEHTAANPLTVIRSATTYHDGNETEKTSGAGYLLADDHKGKIKYYKERITEGGVTENKEYSMEYFSTTGLLDKKHEYIDKWKLTNAVLDSNGRFVSYTGECLETDGSGNKTVFKIVKDSIGYESDTPGEEGFFTEEGFSGSIFKDADNDDVFEFSFSSLAIDGMDFASGSLTSYHEFFKDDLTASSNDVEITKSAITENGYKATIIKDGQIFYVERTFLEDEKDAEGNSLYHRFQDVYYADSAYGTLLSPSITRIYYFETDESTTPAERLAWFVEESEGGAQTKYTAVWNGNTLESFDIEGTGVNAFQYRNLTYYRWWSPYRGQISSFRIADGKNTRVDQITYDMIQTPPAMTGYRLRQDGSPDRVYSHLTDASGFTLVQSGQTYSEIKTSAVNGQALVTSFVHQGNRYGNIAYDTTGASPVVTGYDVTTSNGIQYKNVTLSTNTVTAYTLVESGIEVRYSSVVWNSDGKPSGFTRTTEAGVVSVYSGITYSGSNVTAMKVTAAGVTTAYTFGDYTGTHYGSMTKDVHADGIFEAEFREIAYDTNGNITGFQQRAADQDASFDEDGKVQVWQIFAVSGGLSIYNGVKVVFDYDSNGDGTAEAFEARYSIDTEGNEYLTGYDLNSEYSDPSKMIQMKVASPGFGYLVSYSEQPLWEIPDVDGNFTQSLGSEFMFSKPSILPQNKDIEDYYDLSTVALNSSVFMPASLFFFSVSSTGSLITADSLVLNVTGVNEPITKLKTNSLTPALSSYLQIEKEKLLQQMVTFSSKEVVTSEYMYNEFGQVTGIKTQTVEAKTGKTLESSERTKITVDKLGRTLTFEEKQVDFSGTEKNIRRLETVYDARGNVLSYKQITETKKISSKIGVLETEAEKNAAEFSEAETLLETGYENIEVTEALETVMETVENQIFNDKRELLQYTRKTETTKEGTLENGEKITVKETQTSENTYKYDALGRVNYSEEKIRSSSTPDLVTTQIKSNIRYDEHNREAGYNLQVNELVLDQKGNTLSSVTSFTNRLDTRYDLFGRIIGYKEERYSSQASRKETVTRSNIRYGENRRVKSYEEQYSYGSGEYTRSLYKTDITYDRNGNELTFRQLEKVKDASINAETTLITERRSTVTDAFGNLVKKVERTLGLTPDADLVMENFFQGGELPGGVITNIVFEAGSLDEFGKVVSFRQTTGTALGKIDFEGKFENSSILERVSQKTDSAGRLTETVEKQWNSQEPALVSEITTKDISYTQEGQKSGQTKEIVKKGTYANPVSGAQESYYVKEVAKTESLAYDSITGEVKESVILNTRYDGTSANIQSQSRVTENLKSVSASGKTLSLEKKTDTLEAGKVLYTEELKTEYAYEADFSTGSETASRRVTENGKVVVNTLTTTENQTDLLGRAVRQLSTTDDLLRNSGRSADNLEEVKITTERRMEYNTGNQVTSVYTCTLESGKTSGEIKSGTVTLEDNIRYTGAGTRAGQDTTSYALSSDTLKNILKVNVEELLSTFKTDKQTSLLPAVPLASVFGISAAGATGNTPAASVNVLGLESSLFTKTGTQKMEILSYNLDGSSSREKLEDTTVSASGTETAFTEKRDSILRDSRGNIKIMNVTRQDQGRVTTEYKVLDRQYNAAGRLTLEKIAEPTGTDSKGVKTYAVTVKNNINYDYEGRSLTYTSLRTAADGGMQKTQRLNTEYDAEGHLKQYGETTTFINSDSTTLYTRGSVTEVLSQDADGRVLEQKTESGVVSDQTAFETALEKGDSVKGSLRDKTYALATETMEYDTLGRTLSTHTESSNSKGEKTVSDYKVLSMDDSGRVLSTSAKTVDTEGKTTTSEESGILYNEMNQKTEVTQNNTDAKGKRVVTKLSNMTYDTCGRLKSQTSVDLEGGNSNPMVTRDITYNAASQRTACITEGKNKEGQATFESRAGMKYNADGELTEYYSSGSNNGNAYNFHRTGITYDSKSRMTGYNETGLTSEGVSYNENHRGFMYDSEDRVTQERISGTRAGDPIDETTKSQYNSEGKVAYTETRSNISSDYSITSNISYDARGNRTEYTTQGSKDGKTSSSTTKTSYAFVNGYDRLVSKVESGTRSDGKGYTDITSGYQYNTAGQLKAYTQNMEIRGDTDYVKTVSNIEYNSLGQTTSMTYTDTRNSDFKTGHNDNITETYSYDGNGKQTGSTMTTPDYIVRYDGNGKQIGQAQETAAYRQWREAEEARAYQEAREQAEAELLNGLAGSTGFFNGDNQTINNAALSQILGGSSMYGNNVFMSSMGIANNVQMASFPELLSKLGKGNAQTISRQLAQYATSIAPKQYQAALQTSITREMIAAKVNEKTANLRQELMNIMTRAIAQAVPSGAAKNALLAKIKQSMGSSRMFDKSGALIAGTQIIKTAGGNRFYINGKEVTKAEYAKNAQLKGGKEMNLDLMQELDMSSPEVAEQRCKQLQQALGKNADSIKWPLKIASYDDNGRLQGLEEFSLEKSKDGTTHVKRDYKKYDEAGYLTEKRTFETYKGPNTDIKVDTKYNSDGTVESHVYGSEKDPVLKTWNKVDETRKTKTEAIDGGFRSVTEVTDNITGLKGTITDTYTDCQYAGGKLIAFNQTHEEVGQRKQGDGSIGEIHTVITTRQYDAQLDAKGNLVSYKQDVWSNASPDKHTTMQFTNHSFNEQGQETSQTIETWEKGTGKNGAGDTITLNSYSVSVRTDIKYNAAGQVTDYNEETYVQKEKPSFGAFTLMSLMSMTEVGSGDQKTERTMSPEMQKEFRDMFDQAYPESTTTSLGKTITAKEGNYWDVRNTSQSNMRYDYAGRVTWWSGANGKPNHQIFDHLGLVKSENVGKTKSTNFTYDNVGRKVAWQGISYTKDDMKIKEGHWAEYNTLGQVISQTDTYRGSKPRVEVCEGYRTTFTYDEMGNQEQLKRDKLFDDTHSRTTALMVVKVVVMIVLAILCQQHYLWAGVAAAIAGAVSFACDKADGESTSSSAKNAAIAAAMTYVGGKMGGSDATVTNSYGVEISAAAVDTGTQLGAQAVAQAATQAAITNTAMSFLKNWAMNTLSGMAQGADAGDAVKNGAITAFASMVMSGIVEGINNIPGMDKFITAGSEQGVNQGGNALWKDLTEQLVMKYVSVKAGEHNSPVVAAAISGITQAMLTSVLNGIEADLNENQSKTGTTSNSDWTEFFKLDQSMQNQVLQGMAKGAFYEWLEQQKSNGKISDEEYAALEGAGLELVNSINYAEACKELLTAVIVKPVSEMVNYLKSQYNELKNGKIIEAMKEGTEYHSVINGIKIDVSGGVKTTTFADNSYSKTTINEDGSETVNYYNSDKQVVSSWKESTDDKGNRIYQFNDGKMTIVKPDGSSETHLPGSDLMITRDASGKMDLINEKTGKRATAEEIKELQASELFKSMYAFNNLSEGSLDNNAIVGISKNLGVTQEQSQDFVISETLKKAMDVKPEGDPVILPAGNFFDHEEDIKAGVNIKGLSLTRYYNSRNADERGLLGYGWTLSLEIRILREGKDLWVERGTGAREFFEWKDERYVAGMGSMNSLEKVGNNLVLTELDGKKYTFGDKDKILKIETLNGIEKNYNYDKFGFLSGVLDRYNQGVKFEYNPEGLVSAITGTTGIRVEYYYEKSRLVEVKDSFGTKMSYGYDDQNNVIRKEFADGTRLISKYDRWHRLVVQGDDKTPDLYRFDYDDTAKRITVTQKNGKKTIYEYNKLYKITREIDALNGEELHVYDDQGRMLKTKNPAGYEVNFSYDQRGNIIQRTEDRGRTYKFEYDERFCRVKKMTDPRGVVSTYDYDTRGNLLKMETEGIQTLYKYDEAGHLMEIREPDGQVKSFTYNSVGCVTGIYRNIQGVKIGTTCEYDNRGNLTRIIRPDGNRTSYGYDLRNRIVEIVRCDGNRPMTEKITYDMADRIVAIDFGKGKRLEYTYKGDIWGSVLKKRDSRGRETIYETDDYGKCTRVVDEMNRSVRYGYNELDQLKIKVDATGIREEFEYDAMGRLTEVKDALGNRELFKRDSSGLVKSHVNKAGNEEKFAYDLMGNVIERNDGMGNIQRYAYDAMNRLIKAQNPSGASVLCEYDAMGRLLKMTLKRKNGKEQFLLKMTYNEQGLVETREDQTGNITRYEYLTSGLLKSEIDPRGHKKEYDYDEFGSLIGTKYCFGREEKIHYGENGLASEKIDGMGGKTKYTYDEWDRLDGVVYEQGGNVLKTHYTYDQFDRVSCVERPDGINVSYKYDSLGRVKDITEKSGGKSERGTRYAYDEYGRVSGVFDLSGRGMNFKYDVLGRVTGVQTQGVLMKQFKYNRMGQVESAIDARGGQTSYVYDSLGRLTEKTDPLNGIWKYVYNEDNQLLEVLGPEGMKIAWEYDDYGRMVCEKDGLGNKTVYEYNKLGDLIKTTDANGNAVTYERDDWGRIREITDSLGIKTQLEYDNSGNLIRKKLQDRVLAEYRYEGMNQMIESDEGMGGKTEYQYDALGRMVARKDALGTRYEIRYNEWGGVAGEKAVSADGKISEVLYDLNPEGQLQRMRDESGETLFQYDEMGRLTKKISPENMALEYGYDQAGNKTSMKALGGDGKVILENKYQYNLMNRVTDILSEEENVHYEYDGLGRCETKTLGNGLTCRYSYDGASRITGQISNDGSGKELERYLCIYDKTGNRLSEERTSSESSQKIQYAYDKSNRLTDVFSPAEKISYEYDAMGNRIRELENGVETRYEYLNGKMLVQAVRKNPATQVEEISRYSYDKLGNLTQENTPKSTRTYEYNMQNRLTSVNENNKVIASYAYNGMGERIGKTIGENTTGFVNDGLNNILEMNGGKVSAVNTYGAGVDEILSRSTAGKIFNYLLDPRNNVSRVMEGNVAQGLNFNAFGKGSESSLSNAQPFGFAGRPFDSETGTYYNRMRQYDPNMGRFTQSDPLKFKDGANTFTYVHNNPLRYTDPLGLAGEDMHAYVMYFIAMAAGADKYTAREIAYYSWGPDAMRDTNAMGSLFDSAGQFKNGDYTNAATTYSNNQYYDYIYHGLNGLDANLARTISEVAVEQSGTVKDLGTNLHVLLDDYFHTTTDGFSWLEGLGNLLGGNFQYGEGSSLYAYNSGLAHGYNFTLPDSINGRQELFYTSATDSYSLIKNFLISTGRLDPSPYSTVGGMDMNTLNKYFDAIAQVPDAQRIDFMKYLVGGGTEQYGKNGMAAEFDKILTGAGVSRLNMDSTAFYFNVPKDASSLTATSEQIRDEKELNKMLSYFIRNTCPTIKK